jgi:hypothetical protein
LSIERESTMTVQELEFDGIYYLVTEVKDYYQGRLESRLIDTNGFAYVRFKTHNGYRCEHNVMTNNYRPATRKEKFLLWLKGELPGSIYE